MLGEAVRSNNVMLPGMIGYQEDSPIYNYDPAKCTELLKLPSGRRPAIGTRPMRPAISRCGTPASASPPAYNTGNTARQTIGQILQTELARGQRELSSLK